MTTINEKLKKELNIDLIQLFVATASKYKADVYFLNLDQKANAKSMINLLAIGFLNTETLFFEISGEDETEAYEGLYEVIKSNDLI